jgi:hypothetical protein
MCKTKLQKNKTMKQNPGKTNVKKTTCATVERDIPPKYYTPHHAETRHIQQKNALKPKIDQTLQKTVLCAKQNFSA